MRIFFYIPTALAVLALAVWAYRENYRTQEVMAQVQSLQRQIAGERAALAVLNAEWAYLNRPDRLRALAEINFDRLGLLPLKPEHFGQADQVIYPQPEQSEQSAPGVDPGAPEGIVELSATGGTGR